MRALSFTDSLPVAVIYSARPGDQWGRRDPEFLPTSTVHVVDVNLKPFYLGSADRMELYYSLGDVIRDLHYPSDINEDEVTRIYNYLHNRLINKATGGEFSFKLFDENGRELDDDLAGVPLSFRHPQTLVSWVARGEWDDSPRPATADHLVADTFVFADAPAVQRAVVRMGFNTVVYADVFQAGSRAALSLLHTRVYDLPGVHKSIDIDAAHVPAHWTFRLLYQNAIRGVRSIPTADVLSSGIQVPD